MDFARKAKWTFFVVTTLFSLVQPLSTNHTSINDTAIEMIHVGLILDAQSWVGKIVDSCISMAISDFYSQNCHYQTKLVVHTRDSGGDPLLLLSQALVLLENFKLDAIIVAENSAGVKILAELGSRVKIPIISLFAAGLSLSSFEYPHLIQIGEDESSRAKAIAAIVEAFSWRSVILIYEDNDSARPILSSMTGFRLDQHVALLTSSTDEEIVEQLMKLMSLQMTVYVVHMSPILASRLFLNAKQLGMLTQGYAWITTDMITNFMNSMDPSVFESMQGVVGFKPHIPASKELRRFAIRWRSKNLNENKNLEEMEMNVYGIWSYDMVWAVATAAERVMTRHPHILHQETRLNMNFTTIRSSESGLVFMDEILQSRFKGISGGFQLTNGRLIPKEIEIVNVFKGDRIIGYWNPENGIASIMKEENHTETNSTSSSKLEGVIWPGGTMNIPKGWSLRGKRLRIGVPVTNQFRELISVVHDPQTNDIIVTGFCVDVFKEAVQSLDYEVHYDFIPFEDANGRMAGSYDDLILQVYHKNYDAVVGDITITSRRFAFVDFTLPFTDLGIGVLVPKIDNDIWVFLKPLCGDLWITVGAFFIFTGVVIWFIERPINEEFQGSPSEQIGMIFWYSFSTLVFSHEKPLSNLSKFVVIIWVFVVLIITSSYTATLASMLTVKQIQLSSRDNDAWVSSDISNFTFETRRRRANHSAEEFADALRRGSKNGGESSIIDEIPNLKVFLAKYPSDYTMIKSKAITGGFGFVFPKRSPLVQDISSAIMRLREEKRLEMMENYWFNSESSFTTLDPESNPNRLNIHSFGGLFLVTGISSISALGVCLFQKRQSIKIHLNSSLDSLKGYFNVKIIGRQKERS
ncbi:glutamate receptor 1.2 [Gossypium hirsutum]|uniref:Glutamate receptor n=1 Tax=Gossypium hirsutum TaxID=3635 RepID=A0A1U8P4Q9_GOSHI|nr:glutamate receptor 1.2 [Gossypium hirsutum]